MKAILLLALLALSVNANYAVNYTECMMQTMQLVASIKPVLENVTFAFDNAPIIIQQNFQAFNNTLIACGIFLPIVELNYQEGQLLANKSMELKQLAIQLFQNYKTNGYSVPLAVDVMTLIQKQLSQFNTFTQFVNSIRYNNVQVKQIQVSQVHVNCSESLLKFAKQSVVTLQNVTSIQDVYSYLNKNSTKSQLLRMSRICQWNVSVSWNKSQAHQCYNQTIIMSQQIRPLIQQAKEQGVQSIAIQAMACLHGLSEVKDVCRSAYQSIQVNKLTLKVKKNKGLKKLEEENWCETNCLSHQVTCLRACNQFSFCPRECAHNLKICKWTC